MKTWAFNKPTGSSGTNESKVEDAGGRYYIKLEFNSMPARGDQMGIQDLAKRSEFNQKTKAALLLGNQGIAAGTPYGGVSSPEDSIRNLSSRLRRIGK